MKTSGEKSEIENGARKNKNSDLRGEEVFFALTCAKLHMDVLFGPTGTRQMYTSCAFTLLKCILSFGRQTLKQCTLKRVICKQKNAMEGDCPFSFCPYHCCSGINHKVNNTESGSIVRIQSLQPSALAVYVQALTNTRIPCLYSAPRAVLSMQCSVACHDMCIYMHARARTCAHAKKNVILPCH